MVEPMMKVCAVHNIVSRGLPYALTGHRFVQELVPSPSVDGENVFGKRQQEGA